MGADAANGEKLIRSRNGVTLHIRDDGNNSSLVIETPGGQRMTLQDGPGSVRIEDGSGNSVTLATSGVTVNAGARVTINASTVGGQRRPRHRQRRHVALQRRRAVRHAGQQRGCQRELLPGTGNQA